MLVKHYTEIPEEKVEKGAKGTTVRWLIAENEGAHNFYMRLFEIKPGGNTPSHAHAWEHEVFILEGEGNLVSEEMTFPIAAGDVVFVPGGEKHSFKNTGRQNIKMLCLIPAEK